MCFCKKRGVNVKAKIRSIEAILLCMAVIFNVYLVYLNLSVEKYEADGQIMSTPNYIDLEEVMEEQNPVVYDGKTAQELIDIINKSLNSTISNKGELIVLYSLERNVDPYMATAIMLHETGCKWNCSRLVRECNNVGGQKGHGCGSYGYFNTLDEGIRSFIDNLANNYISQGLITPEQINPKYAEDLNWSKKVNKYIEEIKAQ